MKIKLTSVSIEDYDKALKFYTEVLGFVQKRDIPLGDGARWITVVSPEEPDCTELLLEPNASYPAMKTLKESLVNGLYLSGQGAPGFYAPEGTDPSADLTGWAYVPRPGTVAVDPLLGRIAFPRGQRPLEGVWVSYQYGFSADMGGGEYNRPLRQPAGAQVYHVGPDGYAAISAALAQWYADQPKDAVIELDKSGVYGGQLSVP
ncbi:MAG: hypothetical protein HGA54_07895, partial [Actinobacteria bacterium]|nr:hypothetical protein [Actinomycetota bacterium]